MSDHPPREKPTTPGPENQGEQLILCVDDDPDFLGSMRLFLPQRINQGSNNPCWYRFQFIDNPKAALDMLHDVVERGETIAMVVSDQKMPDMKGTEFLSEVRQISEETIRVLLTGYAGLESAVTAINSHLLDKYLTKPIEDESDFILSIQHLLQRFQMTRTIQAQGKAIQELYQFANVLNGMEDIQQILDYTVIFTRKMLQCDRISLMLIEKDMLRIKASVGVPEDAIQSTWIPVGQRISGMVLQARRAVLADSLSSVPFIDGTIKSQAQSFISMPILYAGLSSGEQSIGVLNVTDKVQGHPFTEADLETLTYIANSASIAIHNQLIRIQLRDAYLESKTNAASLEYQISHDALTSLPNRTMFNDHLLKALSNEQKSPAPMALLMLDLDRFQEVNDTIGHHNGDLLLLMLVTRLQEHWKDSRFLARFGDDEFALLLPETGADGATEVAQEIQKILQPSFSIEEIPINISASIGIALFPDHGEEPNLLIRRAEVAMYLAKKSGDVSRIYHPEDDPYNTRRLMITGDLRRAIEVEQLVLYYQPKINLHNHQVIGAEALIRWNHSKYGLMPPDQFIPLAEQTGLIKPLTQWVLKHAIIQCQRWTNAGLGLSVAVNLSAKNLHDRDLPTETSGYLETCGLSPSLLKLEITENTFMTNPTLAHAILTNLRFLGVHISIDDFGTGHSSLAYLKNLPADEIKIDKSFVKDLGSNYQDVHIVQSIIELGHNLGLQVIAEGVETKEAYDRLCQLGCDAAQGYYISPPLPAEDFLLWLPTWKIN